MPHASTFTRTCPAPGSGMSRSTNSKSPPGLLICAAFIFVLIKCVFFSFAPPWLSYFHRNLFSSRRNFIVGTAVDQSFAISALRSSVELKSFPKLLVEHSRWNEAVQPTQHH